MPTVHLRIEPVFLEPIRNDAVSMGAVSVGTVDVIKLLRDRLHIGLGEAKAYIDRCVYSGETVAIPLATRDAADALAAALNALPGPARFHAVVHD